MGSLLDNLAGTNVDFYDVPRKKKTQMPKS